MHNQDGEDSMKYAYMPFNDPGLLGYVQRTTRDFHKNTPLEKFSKQVLVHDGTTQPLRQVSAKKQLYVFGHGSTRSTKISDNSHNSLSIDDLAMRLLMDGLSLSHKKLKLFSCEGGIGEGHSMAAQLKRAMVKLGFSAITVYGYHDSLTVSARHGLFNSKQGAGGRRAKDIRHKF
jgi:hypothetical protein